jgi:hypothetical protein
MDSVRRFARVALAFAVVALLVASALVAAAMPAVQSRSVGVMPIPSQRGTLDERFNQVAVRAPGFGGMYLQDGILMVYVTNPSQQAAVLGAIGAVFGAASIPAAGVRFLPATYGFAQLSTWHSRMGSLFNTPGVILTDIDERSNRLKVGVESAAYVSVVEMRLTRLGIPRTAVNIVETQPYVVAATLRDRIRPIEGGIQIGFSLFLCTLGFNGVRSGVAGFVVNSHCTDVQGGVEGTQHYQPRVDTGNFIGTEIADPLYSATKCPLELTGHLCRYSDSAYSQRDALVTADQGFIARTDGVNTGSLTISGQFRIVSEGPSVVGATVNKVGRTTGWTQGQVTDTCVNVLVLGSLIAQLCQDMVDAGVGSGDSGSPVFAITSGNDVQLRGILWGGTLDGASFVYSPIANIQRADELGPITTCASGFTC